MQRTRNFSLLACSLLLAVVTSQLTHVQANDSYTVPSSIANIFEKHCVDCHGDGSAEGDVQLDALATLSADQRLALLTRVQEQLHLNQMPPDEKPQPSDQDKKQLVTWITSELAEAGRGTAFQQKMQRPQYGNYVDHDKLFSGEIEADAFSPARLWRRSPNHFDSAKRTYFGVHSNPSQTIGEVDELKQPFHEGDAEGIGDYAVLFYADSATFDTLYRNAAFVVDRTLLLAFIEYDYTSRGKTLDDWHADRAKELQAQQDEIERYKKEGKTTRYIGRAHAQLNAKYKLETPQVYRDIILGDGQPTQAQIEAAIRHHFYRIGLHEPTQEDIDKYARFLEDGIAQAGPYFGLRNVLIAIMISPRYIYRSELGLGEPLDDGRTMLAPAELAYAISYALTDEKPDAKLLEAAQSGRLRTREDVRREVVRLLDDESIEKPRILRFFHEFFGYHHAPEVFKDDARFHDGFTFYKIASRYVEDTDTLVLHILEKDKNVFQELLSTEKYFVGHSGDNEAVKAEVEAHKKLYAYFEDKPWKNWARDAKVKEEPSEEDLKYAQSLHPEFKSLKGDGIHAKMRMLTPFEEKGITPFTYSGKRSRDAQFKGLMAYKKNLLDFMAGDVKKIQQALPSQEKAKLDYYLDALEDLQDQDVKIAALRESLEKHVPEITDKYTSPETELRQEAHFDLIAAALISGITNVVTMKIDNSATFYRGLGITEKSVHGIGHNETSNGKTGLECRAMIRRHHFEILAHLANKLKAVPEGDGNMLDNTMIVYISPAGDRHHGKLDSWPMVVLGGGGKKMKLAGRYLQFPGYGQKDHKTIGNWWTSVLNAYGNPIKHYGDFDPGLMKGGFDQEGPIPEIIA